MTIWPIFFRPAANSDSNEIIPMITWTNSARAILDGHNQTVRQQLLESGADPDEVAADLHRHIEEELTAAKIRIATRDDVQRVLARIGATLTDVPATPVQSGTFSPKVLLTCLAVIVLVAVSVLYFHGIRDQFPNVIHVVPYTPAWSQFSPGDEIAISSVRGDRKHFEPGGRYLVEGTYRLRSMKRGKLSLFVTAPGRDSPGAVSTGHAGQEIEVAQGTGRFSVRMTMRYTGSLHVTFYPVEGGESRGSLYFGERADLAETREQKDTDR